MQDDFTDDVARNWMPDEGLVNVEVISVEMGFSQTNNPKYTVMLASADNPQDVLQIDLTNIPGKRWLLRQLLEATGIEGQENSEGRKIYQWEIDDILGKTVTAKVIHDKTPFTNRQGYEEIRPKAKIIEFKKILVR